jgi:uncharacterized protein YecA (UPF0149 family)
MVKPCRTADGPVSGLPRFDKRLVPTTRRNLDMGAIADAIVAYAQPLLDETDGSHEQLNKALKMSQLCYNLALTPEADRERMISEMRQSLEMNDEEFDAFRRGLIDPMIRRHHEMFPLMHQRRATARSQNGSSPWALPEMAEPAEASPSPPTDRYAPCPCNSGRKFKFCCGAKRR